MYFRVALVAAIFVVAYANIVELKQNNYLIKGDNNGVMSKRFGGRGKFPGALANLFRNKKQACRIHRNRYGKEDAEKAKTEEQKPEQMGKMSRRQRRQQRRHQRKAQEMIAEPYYQECGSNQKVPLNAQQVEQLDKFLESVEKKMKKGLMDMMRNMFGRSKPEPEVEKLSSDEHVEPPQVCQCQKNKASTVMIFDERRHGQPNATTTPEPAAPAPPALPTPPQEPEKPTEAEKPEPKHEEEPTAEPEKIPDPVPAPAPEPASPEPVEEKPEVKPEQPEEEKEKKHEEKEEEKEKEKVAEEPLEEEPPAGLPEGMPEVGNAEQKLQ